MTSEGSGEIERLWWYAKRIVGVTEHQSITSSTLVPSEFEESEDNLLTLVLFNSMRSYVNPKIYWRLSLTRVASFNQKLLPPWSFQKDLLIDREYLIAANSSFNIDKKWIIIFLFLTTGRVRSTTASFTIRTYNRINILPIVSVSARRTFNISSIIPRQQNWRNSSWTLILG